MKIKQRKHLSKKKIALIVAAVLLLLAIPAAYFFVKYTNDKNTKTQTSQDIDYSKPTDEQKKAGEAAEKDTSKETTPSAQNPPAGNNQSPTPQKKSTSVTIVSALQEGDLLRIRTVIEVMEANPGTCTVTVTGGSGVLFTASAKTETRSAYATCQGFDITKAQLGGATGPATVSITYIGSAYQGTATSPVTLQ